MNYKTEYEIKQDFNNNEDFWTHQIEMQQTHDLLHGKRGQRRNAIAFYLDKKFNIVIDR